MTSRPGYHTITPYLVCKSAAEAMEFYAEHLEATERYRLLMPGGSIAHAEMALGDSVLMIADEFPDMGIKSPSSLGGSPVSLSVYVEDVDATFTAMIAAGSEELQAVTDQFHGDRSGKLKDPFGHIWHVGTNKEDLSVDEIKRRFNATMSPS
ncbi:MAG: VOC family protein [Stappiaceae bacterium]